MKDEIIDCEHCPDLGTPLCPYFGDDDTTDNYPPCEFVDDCSDCSHENECFPV